MIPKVKGSPPIIDSRLSESLAELIWRSKLGGVPLSICLNSVSGFFDDAKMLAEQ